MVLSLRSAAEFLIAVQQSFCSVSTISIYFFLLISKYGYKICLFNLLIQVHHACGPKSTCQKFVVHLSKLIMYGHIAFCLHKVKTLLQIVLNSKVTLALLNSIFAYTVPYPNNAICTNGNHWCRQVIQDSHLTSSF